MRHKNQKNSGKFIITNPFGRLIIINGYYADSAMKRVFIPEEEKSEQTREVILKPHFHKD